jgi:hypothetical protein
MMEELTSKQQKKIFNEKNNYCKLKDKKENKLNNEWVFFDFFFNLIF